MHHFKNTQATISVFYVSVHVSLYLIYNREQGENSFCVFYYRNDSKRTIGGVRITLTFSCRVDVYVAVGRSGGNFFHEFLKA